LISPNGAAQRFAAPALFSLFCLLAVALSAGDPRLFGTLAILSLALAFLFTRRFAAGLGAFASPLALLADQALLWIAIVPSAGGQRLFALLLPAGVALAWHTEGRAAARFYAVLSVAFAGALAAVGTLTVSGGGALPIVLTALGAPALLVALEASAGRARAESGEAGAIVRAENSRAATAVAPASDRLEESAQEALLHDLRSPLSVMRVYADLISEGARRGELPHPEHLANLAREIDLAEKLLGGAGAPARGNRPTPESRSPEESRVAPPDRPGSPAPAEAAATSDLVQILGALATAYRLSLAGRRRVEFIAEKPELPVAADPVALQRAFRNVLENAVKYTPEGGEIRIRAGPAGPHAFVVFKDTGIGMTAEERSKAFDFAFRGAGAIRSGAGGKGIGLAVTKQILEANGGRISLSSEEGYGSEVTILLPFARGAK
jgi:signal transduction histidine kinase